MKVFVDSFEKLATELNAQDPQGKVEDICLDTQLEKIDRGLLVPPFETDVSASFARSSAAPSPPTESQLSSSSSQPTSTLSPPPQSPASKDTRSSSSSSSSSAQREVKLRKAIYDLHMMLGETMFYFESIVDMQAIANTFKLNYSDKLRTDAEHQVDVDHDKISQLKVELEHRHGKDPDPDDRRHAFNSLVQERAQFHFNELISRALKGIEEQVPPNEGNSLIIACPKEQFGYFKFRSIRLSE